MYLANKYNATLTSGYTVGQTVLNVSAVPENVPTLIVAAKGTDKEAVFAVTDKTVNTLTGVTRLRGANTNLDSSTPLTCLNLVEFINQFHEAATAKATGAEIDTGTEDAKIVTPKAIADSNLGFLTKSPSGCRAYRSTNQSINNNSETVLQFNTKTYDLGNEWDSTTNYRFTATNAGVYLVRVGVTFEAATNNTILAIRVNGSAKAKTTKNMTIAYEIAECTAIVKLTAGHYIDATVIQNNGSSAVLHENGESQIMIQRIG